MELKKLFFFNKEFTNEYLLNYYKITKKKFPKSTSLIDKNKSNIKNPDVIILNCFDKKIINKYFKNSIIIIINLYKNINNKKYDIFIDIDNSQKIYQINEKNFLPVNQINFYNYFNYFNIIKYLRWDSNFWKNESCLILTPILNKKIIRILNNKININKIKFISFL
mgnify:CR=1 FL=1